MVDCTVGLGGHSSLILEQEGFGGRVIGIDRDAEALEKAGKRLSAFSDRFTALHSNFGRIGEALEKVGCKTVDVILFDLGVSSLQLDAARRGFSFRNPGPLDMRMDPAAGRSAADLVSELSAADIAGILWEYGEERRSRRIAAAIVQERERGPIATTERLAEIVRRAVGGRKGRIDPATRTFQALRIAVNDELGELKRGLEGAVTHLNAGGRLGVISFHSLEDRIVKRFMRDLARNGRASLLTRKPVTATEQEIAANPRARSAKLRALRLESVGEN